MAPDGRWLTCSRQLTTTTDWVLAWGPLRGPRSAFIQRAETDAWERVPRDSQELLDGRGPWFGVQGRA